MKQQSKSRIVIWFYAIVIILIPLLGWAYQEAQRYQEGVIFTQQSAVYRFLGRYISQGNVPPEKLSDVIDFTDWKKVVAIEYYPDAWEKGDRILLATPFVDQYIVTFGNQSRAILDYWHYYEGADVGLKRLRLNAPRYGLGFFGGIWITAVVSAIIFLLSMKSAKEINT